MQHILFLFLHIATMMFFATELAPPHCWNKQAVFNVMSIFLGRTHLITKSVWRHVLKIQDVLPTLLALVLLGMWSFHSYALPAFARQTGQNCLACHAGGQFPELTPYGRLFKLTGYTMGARSMPLSVMAVLDYTRVRIPKDSTVVKKKKKKHKQNTTKNKNNNKNQTNKITDNLGLLAQATYAN